MRSSRAWMRPSAWRCRALVPSTPNCARGQCPAPSPAWVAQPEPAGRRLERAAVPSLHGGGPARRPCATWKPPMLRPAKTRAHVLPTRDPAGHRRTPVPRSGLPGGQHQRDRQGSRDRGPGALPLVRLQAGDPRCTHPAPRRMVEPGVHSRTAREPRAGEAPARTRRGPRPDQPGRPGPRRRIDHRAVARLHRRQRDVRPKPGGPGGRVDRPDPDSSSRRPRSPRRDCSSRQRSASSRTSPEPGTSPAISVWPKRLTAIALSILTSRSPAGNRSEGAVTRSRSWCRRRRTGRCR